MIRIPKISTILIVLIVTGIPQAQVGSMTINFQVRDFGTAQPILAAIIRLSGPSPLNQTTNDRGNATVNIPFGSYTIIVSKSGCNQIGPQNFIVDQNAPVHIIAKLQCPPSGSPPLVNPHVQTDRPQYQMGQIITWTITGFAPGAYVQPCLAELCGAVVQSNTSGTFEGTMLVDALVSIGNQTLTVTDVVTGASTEVQFLILD